MVRVGHNSRGNSLLDNGLSLNGNWDGDVVGSINMDWGGDLNNLLGQERSVIRSIIRLLDMDWGLDIVDLSLGLDNRGIDSLGSLEDSWDSNWKMGGGWLMDLGGISRNIAGLSIVNLLGDNWCGLVNGGDSGSLMSSGVRCRGSGGVTRRAMPPLVLSSLTSRTCALVSPKAMYTKCVWYMLTSPLTSLLKIKKSKSATFWEKRSLVCARPPMV